MKQISSFFANNKFDYPKSQFCLFRILLGIYLTFYLVAIYPYSLELFGYFLDFTEFLPNFLIYLLVILLILFSIFLTLGLFPIISPFALFLGLLTLYSINPLISNPSLPYIGWLLLAVGFLSIKYKGKSFKMDPIIYFGAWIILGATYFFTGVDKLFFLPQWTYGTGVYGLFNSILLRNYFFLEFLKYLPFYMYSFLNYFVIFLFILFPVFSLFKTTRFAAWILLTGVHIVILFLLDLTQVSLGMLIFHLFIFDYSWLNFKSKGND